MTSIGYYRYKTNSLPLGESTISLINNSSTIVASKTVKIYNRCTDDKILKFLDRNGQYRFYNFNNRWQQRHQADQIGSINKFVTSLINDRSDKKNIGYKDERVLLLVAESVSSDELDILSDIYVSPRVFLYIGDGTTSLEKDYIQVEVKGDGIIRNRKNKFSRVDLEVTLPKTYTITML